MEKLQFTSNEELNNKLNSLFNKNKQPRIRSFYAIINDNVYYVSKVRYSTPKELKETPKGKIIPTHVRWDVKKSKYHEDTIAKMKKNKKYLASIVLF